MTVRTSVEAQLPPGPRLPRPVQSVRWLLGSTSFLDRCRERHGDVFTLDLNAKVAAGAAAEHGRWVFLADPAQIKQVFTADPAVVRTGETNRFLLPLVGPRSILVQDEPEHMTQRKLVLPPLHGERVQGYAALMAEIAEAELARWPVGKPFALWPRLQAITLEVIVRTVFGISEPSRLAHVTGLLRTMLNRMTNPRWLLSQGLRAVLTGRSRAAQRLIEPIDDVIFEEIRRRRRHPGDDILSVLAGSQLTDEELRDELMTLLVAGHESTATALAWAFELLLRHPDKLARLREETEAGQDDYTAAVVKETLRLRPVVPFVLRELHQPMQIGDHLLPAGTWLAPCAYLVHRREDVYPEPLRFLPERFIEQQAGAYSWLPFGGGVRRCLGMSFAQLEMKQVLQTFVSHAELAHAGPPESIRARFITLAPSRGTRVIMKRRRQ